MINIRNRRDLELAYFMLKCFEEDYTEMGMTDNRKAKLDEIKREIRRYIHKPSEYTVVRGDWDNAVLLKSCPDWVETEEDAEEWFDTCERITYVPTYYDCTGQSFTSWHKVFKRNGKWMCYHCIAVDV